MKSHSFHSRKGGTAILDYYRNAAIVVASVIARWLGAHKADLAWLAGFAAVAYGVGMIFLPAGVIFAGVAACFTGFALGQDGGSQ